MGIKLNTKDVIQYAAYETLQNGYVKRSEDEDNCTANKLFDMITLHRISDEDVNSVKDRVSKWLEYINSQDSEYFNNIKSEITKPNIDESKLGLIASSFSSFDKHQSFKALNDLDKDSKYLGEEGDSVSFVIKDVKLVKTGQSKFNNRTSKWYLYKFHDLEGNVITCFANENYDKELRPGKFVNATISKLQEYNNIKQTQISKLRLDD